MIAVRPFHVDDLATIGADPDQAGLADRGPSFTVTAIDDGRMLLCAGMVEHHRGYATVWAMLGASIGTAHLALTRATARVIAATRYTRVDMLVRSDHAAGHAWARALGFSHVATHECYGEGGEDWDIYAIVRRDRG